MDKEVIKSSIRNILKEITPDFDREGLECTPIRVARLYENFFYGYQKSLSLVDERSRNSDEIDTDKYIPITTFESTGHEMLIRRVKFVSFCEHHMMPFFGKAWVGIITDKRLLGMNKIDKIVRYFAARLQIQETLTSDVVDWINGALDPLGVIIVVKARHMCAEVVGDEGDFTTSAVRGIFLHPEKGKTPKDEFLALINNDKEL
jgi:GTP cyclohydrolase I